jgi:TolB-like protein/Tfp pilus assembly protein PilF/predicted Ser/Thr protein kinase
VEELRGLNVADIKPSLESRVGTSIAVLPFRNMSADPENEYFSDGLSESIINTLGRIEDLKVVARTSAFSFKGRDVDIREIGRQLSAGHVLEGGVQRTGTRLRITVQLIDAADGCQLWSERYDRSLDDIFAIQDEIALAVVDKVGVKPRKEDQARIIKRHTQDPEAYSLYLKGRYFYNKRTETDLKKSLQQYRAAIDRDAGFALPHAGLADSYSTLGFYHWMPMEEARAKADEAARMGLEIDNTIGETHAAFANIVLWFDWQWERAEEEYQTALRLSPSDVEARHMYAHLLESQGRLDTALREMAYALDLEPLSINLNTCLAQIRFFAGRTDEAIEGLRKTIEMDPSFPLHYFWLGRAYIQKGMIDEAIEAFEKGTRFPAIEAIALGGLGHAFALAGRKEEAQRILDRLDVLSKKKPAVPYYIAFVHAGMKERDKALDLLEIAFETGDMYLFSLRVDPAFSDLHDEPRFRALMKKIGLAEPPAAREAARPAPRAKSGGGLGPGLETKIAHYRIVGKIGEGGMGIVYKAEDTKLRRTVALKFLPPELTRDDAAKARFLREARTAASLDHPHICTVFEINEQEGRTFIAMAFIEGQSLKDTIAPGPLEIGEATGIALQVAEGLKAAHARGIVHRDIKPGNIMVDADGRAKILDFGLAKLDQGADVTRTIGILGTVAYMSPEQARGDPVDRRTDIWSFGATLYEMLTGLRPFHKRPDHALIYAILNEKPEPMSAARSGIPGAVERIILKCLEKDPGRRYQSMDEVLRDLKALSSGHAPLQVEKSIAVLPFTNMSGDPEQDYFCDGMAEEIINALTHIKDLRVIARTSSFVFKGRQEDVREIGRKLNVGALLEGSVRRSGDRIRITAQLIHVADGVHIWSERYDRRLKDVFDIQDEITLAIVDHLKITLMGQEKEAIVKHYTDDPELYSLYLLGVHHWNKLAPDEFVKSENYFEQAIAKDPSYALAYAGVAEVNVFNTFFMSITPREAMQKAKRYLTIALGMDENLAEAHAVLGRIHVFYDWDWEKAEKEFARALELNPNSAMILSHYSDFLSISGQHERALAMVKRARQLDPLSIYINANVGERLIQAGRFDEAIVDLKKTIAMEPHHYYSYSLIGLAYYGKDRIKESLEALEKAYELSGRIPMGAVNLACLYYKQGERREGDAIFKALREMAKNRYVPATLLSVIYHALGDMDEAFRWWRKACDDRDFMLPFFLNMPLEFYRIPAQKRFRDLIGKMWGP